MRLFLLLLLHYNKCITNNQLALRPNHSLKLTESTARDFAARKKIFREMATRSARIVSGDLAARRRSLAPVR